MTHSSYSSSSRAEIHWLATLFNSKMYCVRHCQRVNCCLALRANWSTRFPLRDAIAVQTIRHIHPSAAPEANPQNSNITATLWQELIELHRKSFIQSWTTHLLGRRFATTASGAAACCCEELSVEPPPCAATPPSSTSPSLPSCNSSKLLLLFLK